MSFQTTAALTVFVAVGFAVAAAAIPPAVLDAVGPTTTDAEYATAVVELVEDKCGVTVPAAEVGDGGLFDAGTPHRLGDHGTLLGVAKQSPIAISDVLVHDGIASFYAEYDPEPFCEVKLP